MDPRRGGRSQSVASVAIDFGAALRAQGERGRFDESTLELVALDAAGRPRDFDARRAPEERALVPWRLRRHDPGDRGVLSFVMRDETHTRFVARFDIDAAGRGREPRYRGIVGDGDAFTQEPQRREIAASGYDAFEDMDGDGDLDLVQGGTDSRLRYFENVGENRLVERGLLTSAGAPLELPRDAGGRSWVSVGACDWDGDGDAELFLHFRAGPMRGKVVRFENTTASGGERTFADRGPLVTGGGAFVDGPVTCADWDGDGDLDLLASGSGGRILFHRNLGADRAVSAIALADGVPLQANAAEIQLRLPRPDAADIDGDGDLDLFVGTDDGRVYFFENRGTRREPRLATGRVIVFFGYLDARTGVRVFDWDGDGRLDLVAGRYWERTSDGDQPIVHGRLYRNVGSRTAPRFEERDAQQGAPYTDGFQPVDALRQNAARAVDLDQDGRLDLVAGDTDGYVWLFRNAAGGPHFPVFEEGRRLAAAGRPIRVFGEQLEGRRAGYARPEVADWDGDGLLDLIVADARGWVTLFRNEGTGAQPRFAAGRRMEAAGQPIDGTGRASALVADWDDDGRSDLLLAMTGGDRSESYAWPHLNDDPAKDRGVLFYRNVGPPRHPLLAAPTWLRAGRRGGRALDFERPNLGDLADWDGDGRRDLIVCEFEQRVRLFMNLADPPRPPEFAPPGRGVVLLEAETRQLISGAQAVDWDGDGRLDLVTGQGHGGSGILFFSHDFLEDARNGTLPLVSIVGSGDNARGGAR